MKKFLSLLSGFFLIVLLSNCTKEKNVCEGPANIDECRNCCFQQNLRIDLYDSDGTCYCRF